jgi:phosphoribosyl-AMP cyclohydrolase
MDYQAIRAAVEQPLLTAFNDLSPSVPVFFDNITAAPKNITTEYVRVNLTFGITNEPTLTGSVDFARGALVIQVFTEKGQGPARNQTLLTTAVDVLETLNATAKTDSGVFFSARRKPILWYANGRHRSVRHLRCPVLQTSWHSGSVCRVRR